MYGLDYVTRDRHTSTDQVKSVRVRYDHHPGPRTTHPLSFRKDAHVLSPQTGLQIAIIEFHRRSDAEYFMDVYSPAITFPLQPTRGPNDESHTFPIKFGRNRDDNRREQPRDDEDWECVNVSFFPTAYVLNRPLTRQQCSEMNYSYRARCYKCKTDKPGESWTAHSDYLTVR